MYEVRNECGTLISKHMMLLVAKLAALQLAEKNSDHSYYNIFKVEQVWTTQTLDEAMKEA